jgi:hypothetical protein
MIVINNRLVELPQALRTQLVKEIGEGKNINFIKSLRKTAPIYNVSGNATGQYMPVKPVMRSFALSSSLLLDMNLESENYLKPSPDGEYCTVEVGQSIKTENGITQLKSVERFSKPRRLSSKDYEVYWFLVYICPYIENGVSSKKGGVHHYEIENKEKEAQVKSQSRKIRAKVEHLLSGDESETGISKEKLVEIGYAYAIANPNLLGRDLLTETILEKIQVDEKTREYSTGSDEKGYDFFLKIIEDKVDFKYRVTAQKAIDNDIIGFDSNASSWRYVSDKKQLGTPLYFGGVIVKVAQGVKPVQALLEHMRKHKDVLGNFEGELEEGQIARKNARGEKSFDEMTDVEKAEKLAEELVQKGNYSGAISVYEELKELDRSNKQRWQGKILGLTKKAKAVK